MLEFGPERQPLFETSSEAIQPEVSIISAVPYTNEASAVASTELNIDAAREAVENSLAEVETPSSQDIDTRDTAAEDYIDTTPPATLGVASRKKPQSRIPSIFKKNDGEKSVVPELRIRQATLADIPAIVEVDIRAFSGVYRAYDKSDDEMRKELSEKFKERLAMVGGQWMPVIESNGEILGFMTSCPTRKTPEEFKSWEDMTDNGTLKTTFDPNGDNIYVVTLSVLPEASKHQGQNMLMMNQIGNFISQGYKTGFFESRLPGLRSWIKRRCDQDGLELSSLTEEQKLDLANTYFGLKTEVNGKLVRKDRLIRLYESVGCKFLKVVPDAYDDKPSMNFGVVCVYENPLPESLKKFRAVNWAFGSMLKLVSRSQMVTGKLF